MALSKEQRRKIEFVRDDNRLHATLKILLYKVLREDDQQEIDDAAKDRKLTIHHIIEYKDREGSRKATEASRGDSPVEGFSEGWQDPSWDAEGTRPVDDYYRACLDAAWTMFDKEPYSCAFRQITTPVAKAAILRVWANFRQRQANDDDDDTPSCSGGTCADHGAHTGDRFQPVNDQARVAEITYRERQRNRVTN